MSETGIKKALDSGAAGIIVPHVNSAEDAVRAVHWAKYPPEGGRSVGFSRANGYGTRFQENVETANAGTVVVAQVEHIDGVRAIGSILGVSGVDAVFIGPYRSLGQLGQARADPGRRRPRGRALGRGGLRREESAGRHLHRGHPERRPSPRRGLYAGLLRASTSAFSPRQQPTSSGRSGQETLDRPQLVY